jgi:hypothetical protein
MILKLNDYSSPKLYVTTAEIGDLVHALSSEEHQTSLILTVYPNGRAGDQSVVRCALENLFSLKHHWKAQVVSLLRHHRETNDNVPIAPRPDRSYDYPLATDKEFVEAAILALRGIWAEEQRTEHKVSSFLGRDPSSTPSGGPAAAVRPRPAKSARRNPVNMVGGEVGNESESSADRTSGCPRHSYS